MTEGAALSKTWFGQPRGLTILFLTEMWEQFSYYGMRTLLVYYMTKQLLIGQQQASFIYGLYIAFIYGTPIIGGAIADRWLGKRRAVLIGGGIMACGHFMMTFEPLFYVALCAVALGNGLFLPSLASQINGLYPANDPRRGGAYNIYYVGINLGAFLAPFVCGTLGEVYGWHWGFGAAGIGICCGMAIYIFAGRHYLPPEPPREVQKKVAARQRDAEARRTLILMFLIVLVVVIFRAVYGQLGNTVALWIDQSVDRSVGGFDIPMTWFQALNPLVVFAFTPVLIAHWTRKAKKGAEKTPAVKMATGTWIVAASFLMLALVSYLSVQSGRPASWIWAVIFFVWLTVGELYILPVGLGLFARLAPVGFAATAIAAWFFAAFIGYLASGPVGALFSILTNAQFFALMAALSAISGAFLFLLDRPTRRADAANAIRLQQAGEITT
ncbi:peptide MFS transporter [Roseiterribacter gracilis]|uniref:MFS transporter n=1 Tax=Roseiterribacter gracilis TaxID=2812848 RepID=A0A8S8XE02_9PROT|nr:MFS transporter [Rhodospirillales bacterium TMPK1]